MFFDKKFNELMFDRSEQNIKDWFAGQIISELCREQWAGSQFNPEGIAERAYEIAECMINERKNRSGKTK